MEYNLDIMYQKSKDAILPNAINWWPDFISTRSANKAEKLLLSFRKIDKTA